MAVRRKIPAAPVEPRQAEVAPVRRFVTQSAYAELRGVSPARVTAWIQAGQLVTIPHGKRRLVDVEASDRLLKEVRDPQHDHVRKDIVDFGDGEEASGEEGEPVEASRRYAEARARKEQANAQLAELKLDEERGRLVDRAAMTSAVYDLAKRHQTALLNLPARVAAEVAARLGCSDFEAQEVLEQVVRDHLKEQGRLALRLKSAATVDLQGGDEGEDDAEAA